MRQPSPAATASTRCSNDDYHHTALGGAHRAPRGVLHRLHGLAAGIAFGIEVRLPVSRAVVFVAEAADAARWRSICRGSAFVHFLENHDQVANSSIGSARSSADVARTLPGADRADAARAGDAAAVPGTGVRDLGALLLLRRSRRRAARSDPRRPAPVPRAVSQHSRSRIREKLPVPDDPRARSTARKLDWRECEAHEAALAMHTDLLRDPARATR